MGHIHSFKNIYFFCRAFSFVLFTVHVVKNVQVTSKLSPQNHFITKHILFLKQFHQYCDLLILCIWHVQSISPCLPNKSRKRTEITFYPLTKLEGYSFGVVRPSIPSVRPDSYLSTYWSDLIHSW